MMIIDINKIVSFIYDLVNRDIQIGVKNDKVCLALPSNILLSEYDKEVLSSNRDRIYNLLKEKKIYFPNKHFILPINQEKTLVSYMQETWHNVGITSDFNIPLIFKSLLGMNITLLKQSIFSVVVRHSILRTLIKKDVIGYFNQLVIEPHELDLEISFLNVYNKFELNMHLKRSLNYKFNISTELPIKIWFFNYIVANVVKEYYFVILFSHSAFDGLSKEIFIHDLVKYYTYYSAKADSSKINLELSSIDIEFKDFAFWQRCFFNQNRVDNRLLYWKESLNCYNKLNLPTDMPYPGKLCYKSRVYRHKLRAYVSNRLRDIAKDFAVSQLNLLLAIYSIMLYILSNQTEIILFIPFANRDHLETENLIGPFADEVMIKVLINPEDTFKQLLLSIKENIIESQRNYLPYSIFTSQDELNAKYGKESFMHSIFPVRFDVQNFDLDIKDFLSDNKLSKYDLRKFIKLYKKGLDLQDWGGGNLMTIVEISERGLLIMTSYPVTIYKKRTIIKFSKIYSELLLKVSKSSFNSNVILKELCNLTS